jgi:hypothetical protein
MDKKGDGTLGEAEEERVERVGGICTAAESLSLDVNVILRNIKNGSVGFCRLGDFLSVSSCSVLNIWMDVHVSSSLDFPVIVPSPVFCVYGR